MKIIRMSQNLQFVKTPESLDERETSRAIRDAIINEQLAIQQYEAIADGVSNDQIKKTLQDIADEERVHVGELQALLKGINPEESTFLDEGEKEVKDSK
jgi:rubrerythrin